MEGGFSFSRLFLNEFVVGILFGGAFSIIGSYFSVRFQSRKSEQQTHVNMLSLCHLVLEDFVSTFKKFDDNVSRFNNFDKHSIKIMDDIVYRFETYHKEFIIHVREPRLRKDIVIFFREININLADMKGKLESREKTNDEFYKRMVYGSEITDDSFLMDASKQNFDMAYQAVGKLRSLVTSGEQLLERIGKFVPN